MAGRFNPISTPQFDGKDPRALQTWGTQVRDALNPAAAAVSSWQDGTGALHAATVEANLSASSGFRFPALTQTELQTNYGATTNSTNTPTRHEQSRMPWGGSIVAITARVNDASITAGTIMFAPRVNATIYSATAATTVTLSPTTGSATLFLASPISFAANDALSLHWFTTGFTGTALAYITANLWVTV